MTLNDAAKYTKRAVAYFVLFLILYVIGENLIKGSNLVYSTFFPTPLDPPNVVFGKIERLSIQTLPIDLSTVEYRKSLPTVGFPQFPKFVRVYKNEPQIISPQKEEEFKQNAINLNFLGSPRKASDTKRIWINNLAQQQFEAEVYNQTFKLSTDTNYLESELNPGQSPTSTESIDITKDFLANYSNLDIGAESIEYSTKGVLIKEGLIKETQLPDKEILKFVNLVLKKIGFTVTTPSKNKRNSFEEVPEFFPVWGKNPFISSINTYIGNYGDQQNEANVLIANYGYFKPTDLFGLYPIKSVESAWNELVTNRASVVYIKEDGADFFAPSANISEIKTIDIDNIQLVYYMDTKYTECLQPVFVFSGKFRNVEGKIGNVYFYLPAINEQLLVE